MLDHKTEFQPYYYHYRQVKKILRACSSLYYTLKTRKDAIPGHFSQETENRNWNLHYRIMYRFPVFGGLPSPNLALKPVQ